MFRLRKATIIRQHVSENVKGELYSCSHTYDYKMYGRDLALHKAYVNVTSGKSFYNI